MLKILIAPNNILNTPAKKVEKIDQKIKKLINEMIVCLKKQKDPQGVGLAAPQVGFNIQLFVIKPDEKEKTQVFINPKILSIQNSKKSKNKKKNKLEGCLSIPKIWAPIKRGGQIFVEYTNLAGNQIKKRFFGFESIIIQHEIDHLNGIMFTQRALEQNKQLYEEIDNKLEKITA